MKLVVVFCVILACIRVDSDSGGKNQGSIKYITDPNAKYDIYYSPQKESFFLIDYINFVNAYYYGKTGEVIITKLHSRTLSHLTRDTSTMTWYSKKQSFKDFIQNKISPNDLFLEGLRKGVQFDPQTITTKTRNSLKKILLTQVSGVSAPLAFVLETCKLVYFGRLPYTSKVVESTILPTSSNFQITLEMYLGLRHFFMHFDGGLPALINKNIELDYSPIVTAESGFLIIDSLFTQLHKSFELGKLFGHTFNTQFLFFDLVNRLSGNSFDGFRGLIKVVSMLVSHASGEASKETFTIYLTDYFNNDRGLNVNLKKSWQDSIENCYKKAFDLKLENDLKEFVDVLEQIKSKKWIIEKIDMSGTVDLIIKEKRAKRGQKSIDAVLKKLDK